MREVWEQYCSESCETTSSWPSFRAPAGICGNVHCERSCTLQAGSEKLLLNSTRTGGKGTDAAGSYAFRPRGASASPRLDRGTPGGGATALFSQSPGCGRPCSP